MYAYCDNNPLNMLDPTGLWNDTDFDFQFVSKGGNHFVVEITRDGGREVIATSTTLELMSDAVKYLMDSGYFTQEWLEEQDGWKLSGEKESVFWYLQIVNKLGGGFDYAKLEEFGVKIDFRQKMSKVGLQYAPKTKLIRWSPDIIYWPPGKTPPLYFSMKDAPVKILAHELQHAWDHYSGANTIDYTSHFEYSEKNAVRTENIVAMTLIDLTPLAYGIPANHTREDYIRLGGYPIDEPPPIPPWVH